MGGSVPPSEHSAHFTVELHYTADGVAGRVSRDGATPPEPFSSWLDLLRLLEAPLPADRDLGQEHRR